MQNFRKSAHPKGSLAPAVKNFFMLSTIFQDSGSAGLVHMYKRATQEVAALEIVEWKLEALAALTVLK